MDTDWDHLFLEAISFHGRRTRTDLVHLAAWNGLPPELVDRWLRSAEERALIEPVNDAPRERFWRVCR